MPVLSTVISPTSAPSTPELAAWEHATTSDQRQVEWTFTVADARIKLRHLIPKMSGDDGTSATIVRPAWPRWAGRTAGTAALDGVRLGPQPTMATVVTAAEPEVVIGARSGGTGDPADTSMPTPATT